MPIEPNNGPSSTPSVTSIGWRDTLDALPALAYALRPDGVVAFVNKALQEYSGLPPGTFEAVHWREIVHPDDALDAERALAEGLRSGGPFRLSLRIRSRNGDYRRYESATSPYRDASGELVLWFGVATDVAELSVAVASLAESERRLRTFLETVPLIVWTADPNGWIDWYNPRWYDFTGQTVEEAAGWGWQSAHHPEDFAEVMKRWPHSIATGEPFEMEFRLRGSDGTFRWMLTRIVPLRADSGEILRWYGSNTDIDEQKRAQQRTTRVAQLLQDALLPPSLPAGASFRLDAVYQPAETDARVGGDWYDAMTLLDGRILLSIGDVTGHGVEAAAYAARLRQSISFAALEDPDPAAVLVRINRLVCAQDLEIATAGVAVFDPARSTLTYALAGHCPPVYVSAVATATIGRPGGLPLGVTSEMTTANHELAMGPSALFAFYTDGITEQGRDIAAAEEALRHAAAALATSAPRAGLAAALRDAVVPSANVADDAAVIVLHVTSKP